MDHSQVQCPVCTLYLRNGMTLESHLDTHPKDQVIKALCCLTTKGNNFTSRTSTPLHSDRSFRSRSRTPAGDDRWNGSHQSGEHERYWRRPPSRTPKSTPVTSVSGSGTPDIRMAEMQFEGGSIAPEQNTLPPYPMKSDKTQQTYPNTPISDFDPSYSFYQDQQEDREIKFSRSAEYTAMDSSNMFAYNMPAMAAGVRFQANNSLLPSVPKKPADFVKILPKPNNILVKTNVGGVQYIASGVKPMHVMMPTTPAFVSKNMHSNMIMPSSTHASMNIDKVIPPRLSANNNPFNIRPGSLQSGLSTVMTQNSQIIYREMVHNIDGKPFLSNVPAAVMTTGSAASLAQAGPLCQNLMVVDQFGSCMYTAPHLLPKSCTTSVYTDTASILAGSHLDKSVPSDPKTLIIEVGPLVPSESASPCTPALSTAISTPHITIKTDKDNVSVKSDTKSDASGSTKGLKILSNIKVEVPVQHNKNMVNTLMDLTESNDQEYPDEEMASPKSENTSIQTIDKPISENCTPRPSSSSDDSVVSHSFSVTKNVGNPPLYKSSPGKVLDSNLDTEYGDSCPVPDLICNEKPSISPCSELSENGENSTDRTSPSPKLGRERHTRKKEKAESKIQVAVKPYRLNALRLNNLYVKKNKKILQIKNEKQFGASSSRMDTEPIPSSSRLPEDYSIKKLVERSEVREHSTLQTVSVEEIKDNDDNDDNNGFDADTEEHSLDMEPPPIATINSTSVDMVHVKEEISTSNESAFSSAMPDRVLAPMETLRPVNVITYGNLPVDNYDEESSHRELMSIEAASKNKQFVSMMNDNYFGENMYADYFTQDRAEPYENRPPPPKEPMYGMWGEPSQKDNDFVLPNFIHESYKLAEGGYSEIGSREAIGDADADGCERDSKADVLSEGRSEVEVPLNICADERMPPRGELSGQESNGDMESAWNGMYPEVAPQESYDLMARESWVSDGSDIDVGEKRETLDEEIQYPKPRTYTCTQCEVKFPTARELRAHRAQAHAAGKTSYSRMITARAIKKEEKTDDMGCTMIDSKESITSTILQYDIEETKTKIEGIIKQETKRRRRDFVCPTCKVDQQTDAAFHAHLKIHPLECLTCGKCFYRRANLALHIKTHLDVTCARNGS